MLWFAYVFPVFFLGMFVLISYFISKMGWIRLAEKYKAVEGFQGERVGFLVSASVNSGNYSNAIILKYNYEGIYLKTAVMFRAFHPPVLIPWSEIKEVRDRKFFFTKMKELVIGDPFVAILTLKESVYSKIEKPGKFKF